MLVKTHKLLLKAKQDHFAVGAFNVYNLEGALSVTGAAQELKSPVILQILPSALALGGTPLIRLCREAGKKAVVPVAVHLDHCSSEPDILTSLDAGISSVMADGSMLDYESNVTFTRRMVQTAEGYGACVEAELGRISGTEDGLTVKDIKAKMTSPDEAARFVEQTKICALAVCIGNIHGKYRTDPQLDFQRLSDIGKRVSIPLVLHGTSGLPDAMILEAIKKGVCKFNVNTEIRTTYLKTLKKLFIKDTSPELVDVIQDSIAAMKQPVKEKIRLFGSAGKAFL